MNTAEKVADCSWTLVVRCRARIDSLWHIPIGFYFEFEFGYGTKCNWLAALGVVYGVAMYTRQGGTVWIIDSLSALVGDYQPVLCNDSNYLALVVSPLF
jgi:hypothetical protein